MSHADDTLDKANQKADDFAQTLRDASQVIGTAFEDAIVQGKSFGDVLQGLEQDLIRIALRVTVTQPLQAALTDYFNSSGGNILGALFGSGGAAGGQSGGAANGGLGGSDGLFGDIFNGIFSAKGNAFKGGNVIPFRKGGIVNRPTLFPMANGAGLMGEAGPEAVMPLTRGADGSLGVKASGAGASVEVNIYNSTGQQATATQRTGSDGRRILDITFGQTAARDVASRGPMSQALEQAYGLQRQGARR